MKSEKGSKQARGSMTIELTPTNASGLMWLERMTGTDRTTLVNEFLLRDPFENARDPKTGELRGLVEATVYETKDSAEAAGRRLLKFEAKRLKPQDVSLSYQAAGQRVKHRVAPMGCVIVGRP